MHEAGKIAIQIIQIIQIIQFIHISCTGCERVIAHRNLFRTALMFMGTKYLCVVYKHALLCFAQK